MKAILIILLFFPLIASAQTDSIGTFTPVEFLGLKISVEDTPVLRWSTATETNNDYFVISRMDGEEFTDITTVTGAGTKSTPTEYEFRDSGVSGLVYYKLSQIDFDGTTEVLAITSVNIDWKYIDGIKVNGDATVSRYDLSGRPVSGESGVYVIVINSKDGVKSRVIHRK